tara:strand:- start:21 stop:491 length:471 start_codon:yes stop_codon:yes gene_type:complete
MQVVLNESEQRLAKHIAKRRYEINREKGTIDAKKGEQSNEFVDLEGIAGEIAFCKIYNLYPDLEVKVTTQKTDKGDCIYKGHKIDVKTTSYKTGKLICALWKNNEVDLYALMVGAFPSYEFRGFSYAAELKKKENIINLGRGDLYALTQDELILNI